ncbi:MAG TPA: NADH-quinone oxidoreductase subunit J [Acidimicrobiales bacterium]|nr:NADH-quinone oxidoreductase subunit J [Acidimicrobiales bacterium]
MISHFVPVLGATLPDAITFAVAAVIILTGAVGVVVSRNPVHAALMLVMTLFGIAVLFVAQQANFLAVVQVIVYAGAIVVLFLFVIMFLGVDRSENVNEEPLKGQRPIAAALALLALAGLLFLGAGARWAVGAHSVAGPARGQPGGDVAALGRSVFTTYLFPFEITAALLIIAVVGAVALARSPRRDQDPNEEVEETSPDPPEGQKASPGKAVSADSAREDTHGEEHEHEEVAP